MAANAVAAASLAGMPETMIVLRLLKLGDAETDLVKSEIARLINRLNVQAKKAAEHWRKLDGHESGQGVPGLPSGQEEVRRDAGPVPGVLPAGDPEHGAGRAVLDGPGGEGARQADDEGDGHQA